MILDFLKEVYESNNLEEVWDLHCRAMAKFGFPRLIYGYTRYTTPNSPTGPREDSLFLSNHDPGYFKRFIEDGLYAKAPMVRWAREFTGSCSWNYVQSVLDDLSQEEREVLAVIRNSALLPGIRSALPRAPIAPKGSSPWPGPRARLRTRSMPHGPNTGARSRR